MLFSSIGNLIRLLRRLDRYMPGRGGVGRSILHLRLFGCERQDSLFFANRRMMVDTGSGGGGRRRSEWRSRILAMCLELGWRICVMNRSWSKRKRNK